MTYKVWKMGRTWLQIFFAYSVLSFLCRTSTVIKSSSLYGSERNIFAQLWLLWYSAVNTSAMVCFETCKGFTFSSGWLVSAFGGNNLGFFSSLFGGRGHMMNLYWWKLIAHCEFRQSAHNTGLCLYLGKKQEHLCTAWEHMQLKSSTVLGKVMLQYKHYH